MNATTVTNSSKKQARTNAMTGILVDRIDDAHVQQMAKAEGVEIADGATGEQVAVALSMHFDEKYGKETDGDNELLLCSVCKGKSPVRLPACAFCGEGEDGEVAAKPAPAEAQVAATAATTDTRAKPLKAEKPKKPKGEKPAAEAQAPEASTALAKSEPAPIVHDDTKASSEVLTEATLDDQIRHVRSFVNDHIGGRWKIGHALLPLIDQDMWKLRVQRDNDGKPKQRWKTFDAFCIEELGFTSQWAYSLANIAREYTEDQYVAIGPKKLLLALQAPKEKREQILQAATEGASRREIEREVRTANEKVRKAGAAAPKPDRDGAVRTKPDGTRGGKPKKAEPRITVASILGTQTTKAYKKPARTRGVELDEKNLARAKKVGDVPWSRLLLANGVYMDITLKSSATGELSFVVETRRDEE